MCGILAVVACDRNRWSKETLQRASDTLQHRGPDASGYWQEKEVFLGHRRLSIIDLTTGAQPMISHDGRFVISFNGEIYNFRELRNELEQQGQRFVTQSDTEVILEAYRQWGSQCAERLNGMFAFVIWDRKDQILFATRDRLGIKPLIWANLNRSMLIASTVEPLFSLPDVNLQLDYEALRDVLAYDYIPAPRTILKNVNKLMPGHYLTWKISDSEPQINQYWRIPQSTVEAALPSRLELISRIEASLDLAVSRQMVSDVPIGAFLSGGIDSSLIVAIMAKHSAKPIKTFSISFNKSELDESMFAKEVAEIFQTDHTILSGEDVSGEQLMDIIGRLDEPFADPALIPTFTLSALTRQHVKVALSGDGGDEVFGGYPKYLRNEDALRNYWYPWSRPLKWLLDAVPARPRGASRIYWRTLSPRERVAYALTTYGDFPVFRKDLRLVLSTDAYEKCKANDFFGEWQRHADHFGGKFTTDLLMRTDLRTYLSENCLVKTDRMSMLNSLEVRVPMLDELILESIVPFPASVKILNGQLKSLLLPIAQKLLPRTVWDRPKHGFTVPLGKYLAEDWRKEVEMLLNWGKSSVPIFNYDYLDSLIKLNRRSLAIGRELWTPIVVLIWLHKHLNRVSV